MRRLRKGVTEVSMPVSLVAFARAKGLPVMCALGLGIGGGALFVCLGVAEAMLNLGHDAFDDLFLTGFACGFVSALLGLVFDRAYPDASALPGHGDPPEHRS